MRRSLALLVCLLLAAAAQAQQGSVRVRGELVSLDGSVLAVRTREAGEVRVELAKSGTVAWRRPLKLADLKPGMPLGTTAIKQPDGKLLAREIQVFPGATAPNEGHRPMDIEPGATMTNAVISATMGSTAGREITLSYTGGSQQVTVPEDALIFIPVDGDRTLLVPGVAVTLLASRGPDGRLTATRVQVTKQ